MESFKEEMDRIKRETEQIKKWTEEMDNELLTDEAEWIANGHEGKD